jgi:hypothetical protein
MLMRAFIIMALIALVTVPLAACQGAAGPQGPSGEQGPAGPVGGERTPLPEQIIDTIYAAGSRVDAHLYNLARTSEANMFLAEYIDNRWSRGSCIFVLGYRPGEDWISSKLVYSEQDYEGWDVIEYRVQHIFDSEFEPGTEILQQVLNSGSCFIGCGPTNETTYPVTWAVDSQTGAVTPFDENALRVTAQLLE